MPSADPLSDPGIRAILGSTFVKVVAVVWLARQVLGFVGDVLREIRTNVDWWMTRDQRSNRTTADPPATRVVGLSGTSAWTSHATGTLTFAGSLAAGHAVSSGSAGVGPLPVLAASGHAVSSGTAG